MKNFLLIVVPFLVSVGSFAQAESSKAFQLTKMGFIAENNEVYVGMLTKEGPNLAFGCATRDGGGQFYVAVGPVADFLKTKDCLVRSGSCGQDAFKTETINLTNIQTGEQKTVTAPANSAQGCLNGIFESTMRMNGTATKVSITQSADGKYSLSYEYSK